MMRTHLSNTRKSIY